MAENDDYQFVDPDAFETSESDGPANVDAPRTSGMVSPPKIKRNALFAVLALVFCVSIYSYIMHRHKPRANNMIQSAQQEVHKPVIVLQNPLNTAAVMPDVTNDARDKIEQAVAVLQETQQNIQSDLAGMNEHATRLDERLNTIMTSIEALGQRVEQLSSTLDVEAQRIEHALTVKAHPLSNKKPSKGRVKKQVVSYNVEAVIPGRAWLVGSNGVTITVSVGTAIEGYGRVRMIDAAQGRVLTSSGKIMRFGKDDS